MRAYPGVDMRGIEDPRLREKLSTIDLFLKDVSYALGALGTPTSGGASSGGAPTDAQYVVTAASASLSAEKLLVTSSPLSGSVGAGTVTLSAPTVVTATSAFGTDNVLVRADGTSRGSQSSGMEIDDSALRIRDTGGEFIGMASTTAKTSQGGGAASGAEQTLHSEAMKSGILDVVGRVLHVRASGTWTADATPPATLTLALKYGSTAVWQYTAGVVAGPYTDEWSFECDVITTPSSGNVRSYGFFEDSNGGVLNLKAPSAIAIASTPTTSGAVTVALTITWSGADAGSNFLCEMCTMDLGGLTA